MIELTKKEQEARRRVCLALDGCSVNGALDLANELSDYVGLFKIGKQLHTEACNNGVPIVTKIYHSTKQNYGEGGDIFLDLKFHDTPATIFNASRECVFPGVYMFNVHVAGGEEMCKKSKEGVNSLKYITNIDKPKVIGVTVLTSLNDEDLKKEGYDKGYDYLVKRRTELAREWGLDGVVCPANKAGELEKIFGHDFLYVTPGVEWKGKKGDGQKQLYTPDLAVRDCKNSILVIGSAITKSENRKETAYEILKAMAEEL